MTLRQPFYLRGSDVPVPEGWQVVPIRDCYVQLPVGERYDSKTVVEAGAIPVIDQSADGFLGYHSKAPGVEASPECPVVTFANHTCAMRLVDHPFSVIQNVFPMVGGEGLSDTVYLYYATMGRQATEEYKGHHPSWRNSFIPLPPLELQYRIAAHLRRYDDLIENNRRRIEILEETARLLYREWLVHFRFPGHKGVEMVDSELGAIPEGWEVLDLATCCSRLQAGATPRRNEVSFWDSHDLDWYKTGELQDDFLFESEEGVSAHAAKSARTFEPGTILMAIYGSPTVGRLGVLTRAASCNQAALALVGDPGMVTQTFLYYKLWELRAKFNSIAQGAAQQNISKEKVARAKIALPPLALVREFDMPVSAFWKLRENLGGQNRVLREARDLLLPRLVSGELDVLELDLDGVLV